jgi:hypothetical protein
MREERSDDIPKFLEFFRRCKSPNEYFYWDAQIDGEHVLLRTYFGATRASVPNARISALLLLLIRCTRPTNIGCHWQCLSDRTINY